MSVNDGETRQKEMVTSMDCNPATLKMRGATRVIWGDTVLVDLCVCVWENWCL